MKKIDNIRHSLAHILAMALKDIFPGVKLGIGPVIQNGFYYDVLIQDKQTLSKNDLEKIEKEMKKIVQKNISFTQKNVSAREAKKIFKNEPFKLELIEDLEQKGVQEVSTYTSGNFIDLCKGPHIKNTREIDPESFKLTSLAGAYWKGSENNQQMQRIYGVAFENANKLKIYLDLQKETEQRDHRLLAKKLDLFHIDKEVGPGLILWHPKGALIKRILENYILEKYLEKGYQLVNTPHIANISLWNTSGHTDFYKESMFPVMHMKELDKEEKGDYQLKPMNCPFHMKIYGNSLRSYKDLPIRYTELGTVYRYEKSGTLHGLVRARGFTQDDAHLFCAGKEQLFSEIQGIIQLTKEILGKFEFKEYEVKLSVRDPKNKQKYLGSDDNWKAAENTLEKALRKEGWKFEKEEGEAVFYGPKIDIKVKDSLGRLWQISTVQIDFNLPEKFNLNYIDKDGHKTKPFVIHRALLGSLERFIGVLIEHYGGAFPLWLAPVQIQIIPITDKHVPYGKTIFETLKKAGFRTELNDKNETVSKKIRQAEIQKIPYLLIVGDREKQSQVVRIRERQQGDIGEKKLEDFIKEIQ